MRQESLAYLDEAPRFGLKDILGCGAVAVLVLGFFSPALLSGASLAPGDGSISYLPNFYRADGSVWIDDIYGGYAAGLDPQFQLFYPPFWLSPSYPLFVLFAYLSVALGSYWFALALSGSRNGATVAALMVAFGGFMTAHLGHATIIHAAAWIPWILWALRTQVQSRSVWPMVGGAVATCLCLGGGHPQVSIIGLTFAGFYALSLVRSCRHRKRMAFLLRAAGMFGLGLALAAPILAGYYAASTESVRGSWSEADFNTFSYTSTELALLLFPNSYGAHPPSPYGPYSGPYNLTELAAYMGWLPWFLLPLLAGGRALWPQVWFWLLGAAAALLLMFGTLSPLGMLAFELPVFGQFRAQARFGIVLCLCLAMASALTLAALEREELSSRSARIAFWIGALMLLVVAIAHAWPHLATNDGSVEGWLRFCLPLVIAALTLALLSMVLHLGSRIALGFLPLLLIADLASFGWFYEWRDTLPLSRFAISGAAAESLQAIGDSGTRVLPPDDSQAALTPLTPNVNLMHRVPLVTGYGPLADPHYLSLARANTRGGMAVPPADAAILDLLRVGWVAGELSLSENYLIGSGCGAEGSPAAAGVRVPAAARWLRVTSHVACGIGLENTSPVASLSESHQGREYLRGYLRAGIETAEWAHARPDVANQVKHRRPANSIPFEADGFLGYWYVADLELGSEPHGTGLDRHFSIASMAPGSPMRMQSVQFSTNGREWHIVVPGSLHVGYDLHFTELPKTKGLPRLFRRVTMPPQYWMPCNVRHAALDDLRARLWTGGAQRLNVRDTLLVDPETGIAPGECSGERVAEMIGSSPGHFTLRIGEGASRPLVLASTFHRGWTAISNGRPLRLFRAYGLNLAVMVPAGPQEIVFEFAPRELKFAFVILALGIMSLVALILIALRQSILFLRPGVQS